MSPRWFGPRVQGIVVVVLALVAIFITSVGGARQNSYQHCANDVMNQLVVSQRARGDSVDARDHAFDALVDAILNAKSPGESRAALEAYRAAVAKVEEDQRNNPLPQPPEHVCS